MRTTVHFSQGATARHVTVNATVSIRDGTYDQNDIYHSR